MGNQISFSGQKGIDGGEVGAVVGGQESLGLGLHLIGQGQERGFVVGPQRGCRDALNHCTDLTSILELIAQMNTLETHGVEPLAHPPPKKKRVSSRQRTLHVSG